MISLSKRDPAWPVTKDIKALARAVIIMMIKPVPNVTHHFDLTKFQLPRKASVMPEFSIITKQDTNQNLTIKNISNGIPMKNIDKTPGIIRTKVKIIITLISLKILENE